MGWRLAEVILENVSYTYPGESEPTLSGLNLTIQHGSAHALLGASGAGKSTMLGLLSGLLHPTEGRILFDGVDVSMMDARARDVALVFQFPVLYESKSVIENLMFPLLNRGMGRDEAMARAQQISLSLDIEGILEAKPTDLSLFQKQLVAIAKSLAREDIDLLLLDEPLTAVEPGIKWQLRQMLTRIQKTADLTIVYVTHDQVEALTFAEEVSLLAGGTILQTGTPRDIYQSPNCPFVGYFIGSPGMQFVDCRVVGGIVQVDGLTQHHAGALNDLSDGNYRLGSRVEWLKLEREAGAWLVQDSHFLGTDSGEVRNLVTLTMGVHRLQAEARGDWAKGDKVGVKYDKFVVFDAYKAVAHG